MQHDNVNDSICSGVSYKQGSESPLKKLPIQTLKIKSRSSDNLLGRNTSFNQETSKVECMYGHNSKGNHGRRKAN